MRAGFGREASRSHGADQREPERREPELHTSSTASLEWIELRNVSGVALTLDAMKVGDATVPETAEAMRRFPGGYVTESGNTALVARSATVFTTAYGSDPDFEINPTSGDVPDLTVYVAWTPGPFDLSDTADEVLVLDRWDTVLDILNYGVAVVYGQTPIAAPASEHSLERNAGMLDRNNCATDFFEQATPNPTKGTVDVPGSVLESGLALGPAAPDPCERATRWRLVMPRAATLDAAIVDLQGRRVRTIERGSREAGVHTLQWDLRDDAGLRVPAGTYFARVDLAGWIVARPVVVLR